MKRQFKFLLVSALSAALALQAGTALAGGFKFGGGGGGGGGNRSMPSLRSGNSGGMQFKRLSSGAPSRNMSGISSKNLSKPKFNVPNNSIRPINGNQIGVNKVNGGFKPSGIKIAKPVNDLGGRQVPAVKPNVLTGNVKSHLIGNGTGARPQAILNGPGKKVGIGIGDVKPVGGVQGKIAPAIGKQVAGKIGIGGPGSGPNKPIGIAKHHLGGQHHDKFCGTPWPGKGKADCHHVINLLVKHCVAKNDYHPCVKHYCPPPVYVDYGWIPVPVEVGVQTPVGVPGLGDLELVDVAMITDAMGDLGPLYQVTVRNSGESVAEQFRVSMVAVLGEITEDSPSVTVNVDRLAPGETATMQVQLPGAVLAMGPEGETAVGFDTLVVAVDSFDELVEANELNNVGTFKRAEIVLVQVEGVATETTVAAPAIEAPAGEAAPVEGTEEVPAVVEEGAAVEGEGPAPNEGAGPTEGLDIDNLELEGADSASELFVK